MDFKNHSTLTREGHEGAQSTEATHHLEQEAAVNESTRKDDASV